ncbi:MAG: 3-methyl-2-oxobutanoate hydroxymethyltransferase [Gammaproteobacteria bacterium]|nr:MAG: 3-methyl-2-oxobutanoate hydroxymethyltransferase [Gammaproteobacteria bacterium]
MAERASISNATLLRMKERGEKISCVTSYDASFTCLLEDAGVELVLIGDSLGMVLQGHDSTLPVSMDDMVYHSSCVARAGRTALRVVDMPFMSYSRVDQALDNAARLMREGGAHMVKLEGGERVSGIVRALTAQGIPVCGHLGLTPQSVHQLGGYRVQGREAESAQRLREDALLLQEAGASALVLECIPAELARQVSESLRIPTIGIGAGPDCDGQVLVLYDLLGVTPGKRPGFSHNFLEDAADIPAALRAYVEAVKAGSFPEQQHSFS